MLKPNEVLKELGLIEHHLTVQAHLRSLVTKGELTAEEAEKVYAEWLAKRREIFRRR